MWLKNLHICTSVEWLDTMHLGRRAGSGPRLDLSCPKEQSHIHNIAIPVIKTSLNQFKTSLS